MRRFKKRAAAAAPSDVEADAPARCPPLVAPDVAGYPEDLERKVDRIRRLLSDRIAGFLEVCPSKEPLHYRHRVKFELRHRPGGKVVYVIFDPEKAAWLDVESYPIASRRINRLMRDSVEAFEADDRARDEAFQVELLSNTAGDALASVMYHRPLDTKEDTDMADRLARRMDATVVLRAKGQRLTDRGGFSYLEQANKVAGRQYKQRLLEAGFFQANLRVNRMMQRWAVSQTAPPGGASPSDDGDLLELFCGNGNFTLPMSANFRKVLATELDQRAVAAAGSCARQAKIENVRLVKMKAEKVRTDLSLGAAGSCGEGYNFTTLFVDPPRVGLDRESLAIAGTFDRVIYVSCCPTTLARDLALLPRHDVASACLFDQFPWTDHAEVAVRLQRRA